MILRIANGGMNMPAYAANLTPGQMDALVAFLQTRKISVRDPGWIRF
jgi:mono/diheme cytochrome c family protein